MSTSNHLNQTNFSATGKIPLHSKVRKLKPTNVFNLDAELLSISTCNLGEKEVESLFRKSAIVATKGVGVCIVHKPTGSWQLDSKAICGRAPAETELLNECGEFLDEDFSKPTPSTRTLDCLDGLTVLFAPIRTSGSVPQLMLLVLKDAADLVTALQVTQKVIAAQQLWKKGRSALDSEWQISMLATIIELVGMIENCATQKKATDEVVNELARCLRCDSVAIGVRKKPTANNRSKLTVAAISGVHKIDRSSNTNQNYLQTMWESSMRGTQAVYPAAQRDNDHLLLAHKQLAGSIHCESVISQPLQTNDDKEFGVLVFTGSKDVLASPRFSRFAETAAPHIANAFSVLRRAQKGKLRRAVAFAREKTSVFTRLMIPLGIAACCFLMLVPVTYRVRCQCTTEPVLRRFAVAPFDGLIVSGFVEPGDVVKEGQVLAEIDGRTIRWELSGISAERKQSLRQREMELAEENIPKLLLAELENERLTAQEAILKFKKDNLRIVSPIDGVVLSGSLERSEAASIKTGQVLFEVGPIDSVKIQIEIPSIEVAQVQPGHNVTIWIEGQEDQPLSAKIEKLHPRSITRDGKNVFIAELKFENDDERLRPGMKGAVRVDCGKRSLGWSLFHKPINYVRSRYTFW
jgi:hypothetical protein